MKTEKPQSEVQKQRCPSTPEEILRGSAQLFPDPVRRVRWLLQKAYGSARRRDWEWAYRFARKAAFWTGEYETPTVLMGKAVAAANRYAGILNRRKPGSAPVTFGWPRKKA